jgi:hypothetical protein
MAFDSRGGADTHRRFEKLMGRTYVAPGEHGIRVLDPRRQATLAAWVGRLIPGDENWPNAAELDTVEYVDAVVFTAPELRPLLLAALDRADVVARAEHGDALAGLEPAQVVAVLTALETEEQTAEAFALVLELTYEAYYRHERVLAVVAERTGFDIGRTVNGAPLAPFPVERLDGVKQLPVNVRAAS